MSKRSARGAGKAELLPAQPAEELEVADLQLSSEDDESDVDIDSDLASLSGSDGEDEGGSGVDREIEDAVLGYMAAADKHRRSGQSDSRCAWAVLCLRASARQLCRTKAPC
jgi:hypothetical protein